MHVILRDDCSLVPAHYCAVDRQCEKGGHSFGLRVKNGGEYNVLPHLKSLSSRML